MPLNPAQRLFLDQARSDYQIFKVLRGQQVCHRLHYLQMCTEKLAKVYSWRHGTSPGLGHFHFKNFLKAIDSRPDSHELFGHKKVGAYVSVKEKILILAGRIEALAPAGGNTGPNPEYPWPPFAPVFSPLTHPFAEWVGWNDSLVGRRLKQFVENMLDRYETYFP